MGFLDFFRMPDMNQGVEEYKSTPDAVLVDVRTTEEYAQGHVPESIHIPLDKLPMSLNQLPDKNAPLFVHCLSGSRSGQAVEYLRKHGYSNAKNIGGISGYRGKVVR